MKTRTVGACVLAAGAALAGVQQAAAADWSDTSIGLRYGTKFHEPFNSQDITKSIVNLTHASGYKYGTNFFNADFLVANDKDPSAFGSTNGSHEIYIVYRHTLDLGKVTGSKAFAFGPVRGTGITAGFDVNTKTDVGYNSKKRMFVFGPTLFVDVPGFLNVSLLLLKESNQPSGTSFATTPPSSYSVSRYTYKTHPMLTAAWGIPLGGTGLSFEGFMNYIASKGTDEFGGATKPETNIDMQLMYDLGPAIGAAKNTFKVGLEYQYWRNKFGNSYKGPAGPGAFAKTPMVRAEYHF